MRTRIPTPLILAYDDLTWALDVRPLTIGRLPECDVVVAAELVSRNHAYLLPTPAGPLLVDRSRHGTMVNGEARQGICLLHEGDEIRVGPAVLLVRRGDPRTSAELAGRTARSWPAKLRHWIRRYGPSEVFGTVAAVGVAGIVKQATGSTVAAAYLGTIAEIVVFYGIMFLRESIREAHQAGRRGRTYGNADLLALLRNLGLEFGVAELLDTGLVRPLCIGLGLQFIGGTLGALAGKLIADLVFYGPVLAMYEWRLARTHSSVQRDRLRRTTSPGIPIPPK